MFFAQAGLLAGDFFAVGAGLVDRGEAGDDPDGTRGVLHVDHRPGIVRRNLDRRMGATGRCTADQQRLGEALALHFCGDMAHFFERGGDEAGETDHLHFVLTRGLQDFFARHHDADVDHLKAIATEHDADDVLADVVHVTLDGGQQHAALARGPAPALFFFNERD